VCSGSSVEVPFHRHSARCPTMSIRIPSIACPRFNNLERLRLFSDVYSFFDQILSNKTKRQFGTHAFVSPSHYLLLLVTKELRIRIRLVLILAIKMLGL
jgi:hypothetical protein